MKLPSMFVDAPTKNPLEKDVNGIKAILDFYCLEQINPTKFEEVKQVCLAKAVERNADKVECVHIELGYLSIEDFLYTKHLFSSTLNFDPAVASFTIGKLVDNSILTPFELFNRGASRYRLMMGVGRLMALENLLLNVILGYNYIVQRYSGSVVQIEHMNSSGDLSCGTGFYCRDLVSRNIVAIATNKHVVDNAQRIRILDKNGDDISYSRISYHPYSDLALIYPDKTVDVESFIFDYNIEILSEVITMGYPSIPLVRPTMVAHKGEVNSIVETYNGESEYFLFSAKTSSGNSGSPIINKYGMVVGIITQEFFDKSAYTEKGKPPYYAAIPSMGISVFMSMDAMAAGQLFK